MSNAVILNDNSATTYPGAAPFDSDMGCLTDDDLDDYGDMNPEMGAEPGTIVMTPIQPHTPVQQLARIATSLKWVR